jgi:ribosomal protein S9
MDGILVPTAINIVVFIAGGGSSAYIYSVREAYEKYLFRWKQQEIEDRNYNFRQLVEQMRIPWNSCGKGT